MSEDDIITMMVGRELTALYPNEPHTTGDEILRIEHLTAWHPVNRHIKRVNDVSAFPETWRNTGYRRTRWCRTYRDYSVPVWCVSDNGKGKIYIDGKQVDIRNQVSKPSPRGR